MILAPYSYSPQPGPFIRFTGLFFCPLTSLISQLCLGCQVFYLQCNLVRAPWPASLASRNTNARSPPQSVIFFSNSETPLPNHSLSLSLSRTPLSLPLTVCRLELPSHYHFALHHEWIDTRFVARVRSVCDTKVHNNIKHPSNRSPRSATDLKVLRPPNHH